MQGNILITGVSRGLGLAIARAVVAAGWNVYGVSRTLSDEYRSLMEGEPSRVFFRAFDLSDADGVKAGLFGDFVPFGVPLHGFVNNAAQAYDDIVTNLDAERLRSMYAVNVFAPMMATKYAIRNMLFNRVKGAIVHVSSISVHTGYKGLAMYASTKGALEAFSKNTAREWGERGIRSNCVVAGFMETAMSGTLSEEQRERIHQRTALKEATRLESVADTIVFLLGDGAASVTGQNVFVDSGTI
ncbi:SDR family oxidoreductase [Opitutales bacterium ASA1]|uniref:SDR family NAD(P)-dependent oxidoreductase n=1 Tax=Congregicoccus parvus TaxID=3081749 RepID=UPI002B27CC93|nr:SDR family oxidoreductase [Opitutales bacterium ASA1]